MEPSPEPELEPTESSPVPDYETDIESTEPSPEPSPVIDYEPELESTEPVYQPPEIFPYENPAGAVFEPLEPLAPLGSSTPGFFRDLDALNLTPSILPQPEFVPDGKAKIEAVKAVEKYNEPSPTYIARKFFTREIEAQLLATRSSQEFLDVVPDNVLGYMDVATLRRLTRHLVEMEPRTKVARRKPYSTPEIMKGRKKFRNRRSAKKSKAVIKVSTNAIKRAFSAIADEIKTNPGILNHFTKETRALIDSAR